MSVTEKFVPSANACAKSADVDNFERTTENSCLTGEGQHIFTTATMEIKNISENGKSFSAPFRKIETTTSVQDAPLYIKGDLAKVKLRNPKSYESSLTTLDFIVCDDETLRNKNIIKEVDELYRQICHEMLESDLILSGNVAVTLNKTTNQYCRVRILGNFVSTKKEIYCKLLDDFGELRVNADSLLKLANCYGKVPPKVQKVRLEHLKHYDDCVALKSVLLKRLSKKSNPGNSKKFLIEFTGFVDENGIPLGYLKDDESSGESINRSVMTKILEMCDENMFSKIGDIIDNLNVTHMLPSGHTYLQNKQSPMYKHLESLLGLFPLRKDELVTMEKRDVTFEDFYLTEDSNGQVCRVEVIPPQYTFETYDYTNGVCVDFTDRGDRPLKPVPFAKLYLASDLDPILGQLPRQCYQVKLFRVPLFKPVKLHRVRNLLPPDELFTAVAAGIEVENGFEIFSVELYNEKTSKFHVKEIEEGGHKMIIGMRNSVNAEFLKIDSDEKRLPMCFTTLQPLQVTRNFLNFVPENPVYKIGKRVNVFIESVYSYRDFIVISKKSLQQRKALEIFLQDYRKDSPDRDWMLVSKRYTQHHPNTIYVVPMNTDTKTICRAVVVEGRIDPKILNEGMNELVQVYLMDYAIFQVVAVGDLDIMCLPQYCKMPPLAVAASIRKKKWERKTQKTFSDFQAMTETFVKIKVRGASLESGKRMRLNVTFVNYKKSKSNKDDENPSLSQLESSKDDNNPSLSQLESSKDDENTSLSQLESSKDDENPSLSQHECSKDDENPSLS